MDGEKVSLIAKVCKNLNMKVLSEKEFNRKLNININEEGGSQKLIQAAQNTLRIAMAKQKSKEYGFVCLFTDGKGNFWHKVSRGFMTAFQPLKLWLTWIKTSPRKKKIR